MGIGLFGALLGSAFQTAFPGPRGPDGRYQATHAGKPGRVAQARRAAQKKRNRAASR